MYKYAIFILLSLIFFSCSSVKELNFVTREGWNADTQKPFPKHVPERITIHHEGTIFDPSKESAAVHIKNVQKWGMSEARNWADIPYHFIIDFDGNVFEGRNVFTVGETATEYDPTGHLLITCLGNFEVQELPEAQYNALVGLIAHCCDKYRIAPETMKGHKDFAKTDCPGKNLYSFLQNGKLLEDVKIRLAEIQK
ncbi:MAG TPA: peptidoglycan recognition family protein [Ignavibacteriaceae bacterium]|nr:peptidoglycan recognition family protein [Ignavibacteriaceae bacterium]